jgi:lipopolysaccharide/colanic/teichoic acid biosynthesis glycosyltransferase
MGLIWSTAISILGLLGTILIAVAGRLLTDDAKEWLPWITRRLIERAVNQLPQDERERHEEEWRSHVNEWPGTLAKIYIAWGFLSAAKAIHEMSGETPRIGRPLEVAARRCLDVVITGVLFLLILPIFCIVPLCIKLDSPGPIFFKQKRLGCRRSFNLIKFRSMYIEQTDAFGHQLAGAEASCVTPVGRLLRATNLDELPQLINVLKGEMSLVGPRPHEWSETLDILLTYQTRHRVKPGLTGWAQVNGSRGAPTTSSRCANESSMTYITLKIGR